MPEDEWCLRLRFKTHTALNNDEEKISLLLGGRKVVLHAASKGKLKDQNDVVLLAKGFRSEKQAISFGNDLRSALLAASAMSNYSIDIGQDNRTSTSSPRIKHLAYEREGVALIDDIHGLSVFSIDPPPRIFRMTADFSVSSNPERLLESLKQCFNKKLQLSDDQKMAIDLYNAAGMESSHYAKLLLAMNAIEHLSDTGSLREKDELSLIGECIRLVEKSELPKTAKVNVSQFLRNGRTISKAAAGRRLLYELLPDEVEKYNQLSDYRGKIAHPSKKEAWNDVGQRAMEAHALAGKLIARLLEQPCL